MTMLGFRHCKKIEIRFADLDAMGHVNNAVYLTYLETARSAYARELGVWDGMTAAIAPIMAKAVVEYKLPLTLSDNVIEVYTRCSRLGNKSYDMEHLIVRQGMDIAASGTITLVVYDYRVGHSTPIPDEWRRIITAYEPALSEI